MKKLILLTGLILVGTLNCSEERPKSPINLYGFHDYEDQAGFIRHLERHVRDINKQDEYGRTLLHTASFFRSVEVTEWLLAHGADCNICDDQRRTPLKFALQQQSKDRTVIMGRSMHIVGRVMMTRYKKDHSAELAKIIELLKEERK